MSHKKNMVIARAARRKDGLQETFAEQTRLRNDMSGMRRMLQHIENDDIPETLRQDIKERVQQALATSAEALYHLTKEA
jgi:hypothetical protein